jgi:hypothetical protein
MMPWNNSWFQFVALTSVCSAALLVADFSPSLRPWVASRPAPAAPSTAENPPSTPPPTEPTPPDNPSSSTPPPTTPAPTPSYSDTPTPPAYGTPVAGKEWTNTLGVVFRVVPGVNVLFADIDTRVSDFASFCDHTGYNAVGGMNVVIPSGIDFWQTPPDATWKNPGFTQTDDCPVTGVSWNDAEAFCQWLTKKEQAMGWLTPQQKYRLPTNAEWDAAAGPTTYPWGNEWPPPPGSGNFAGGEINTDRYIHGYNDGYPRTSPVGTFRSNAYALLDMSGNVWQWTEDWAGGEQYAKNVRGGSWDNSEPSDLKTSAKFTGVPDFRSNCYGFRVVIDLGQP